MPISFSIVATDLMAFIKKPGLDRLPIIFRENPQKVFAYLLGLDFILMFFLSGLLAIAGVEEMEHEVQKLLDNPILLALMAVVFAPLVEEAVFRLPLRYSTGNLLLPLLLVLLFIPSLVSPILSGVLIGVILLLLLIFYFFNQKKEQQLVAWLNDSWKEKFPIVFWFFTLAFAALHLTNFSDVVPFYLVPILILPQFALGIIIGYIRVGWGFWYGVLFHAIHNGIFVGIATIAKVALE